MQAAPSLSPEYTELSLGQQEQEEHVCSGDPEGKTRRRGGG